MSFSLIASIGTANPPFKVAQEDIYSFMAMAHGLSSIERDRLKKIYDASGIHYRYSVVDDYSHKAGEFTFYGNGEELEPFPTTKNRALIFEKNASELGAHAALNCFAKVPDLDISAITHLITVTCTGLHAPGMDIELISKLGLNEDVERTSINFMGCYAAFNALKTADYICKSDSRNVVLIINVELCTLHFQRENLLKNWLANVLFADGASAVVVHSSDQDFGAKFPLKILGFYSKLMLEAQNEMTWGIGDFGFEMSLGTHISKRIKSSIKTVATDLLKKVNLQFKDIGHYAIHPGGRRILEVCEEELAFEAGPDHPSYSVLRDFGNMSSVTIFFVLNQLLENFRLGSSARGNIMSFAFGPGLTFESMALEPIN